LRELATTWICATFAKLSVPNCLHTKLTQRHLAVDGGQARRPDAREAFFYYWGEELPGGAQRQVETAFPAQTFRAGADGSDGQPGKMVTSKSDWIVRSGK